MPLRLRANAFIARPTTWLPATRHGCVGAPLTRALSAVTPAPRREQFSVPCRSNGSITVDIFHASSPSPPVVVYLPSGPIVTHGPGEEDAVITALHEHSGATIARINYRASTVHKYPTPIHDVLAGFDWLRDTFIRDEFNRSYIARLGVCGQLLGGSLAAMLALTECRLGESRIGAAAINNPVADWVFPEELLFVEPTELPEPLAADETALPADEDPMSSIALGTISNSARKPRKRSKKEITMTAWQLYSANSIVPIRSLTVARDFLFRRTEDYFDPFASPIHYFRSPVAQLVLPHSEDTSASLQPDILHDVETQMTLDHYTAGGGRTSAVQELPTLTRCRAYMRGYPPAGSKINIPAWNVTTGLESPLSDQGKEITKMLRRSIARHTLKGHAGRTRWHDAIEKQMYEEIAEERVLLNEYPGVGLWTGQAGDFHKRHLHEIGYWLKKQLELGAS
ncbi:Alpha/Beta hydrolase protein [Paraphoma chrysanthemicola]|nr:Alpha/Beta hydrolase protein [Paraphoma chrysanthemicola]